MSAWDIALPHRLLLNRSLRKVTAELRSNYDEHKTKLELKIKSFSLEVEQARVDKDRDFDKLKNFLIDELSKDAILFDKVQTGLLEYADVYLRRQYVFKMQEIQRLEKLMLLNYRNFLSGQINLIKEEIEILEERKDKLVERAKIDDFRDLIGLTASDVIVNDTDDASSLLYKVSESVKTSNLSDKNRALVLKRLHGVLQERSDLLPLIRYISWMILQKKQLSRQLSRDKRKINDEIKDKARRLKQTSEDIDSLSCLLDVQARTVRACWATPITQLNIQISFLSKRLKRNFIEVKEIGEKIESMKSTGSRDSFTWERLWRDKSYLKDGITLMKKEIDSLKTERQQWYTLQQTLFSLCEKSNLYLLPDGKAEASDEYRIIECRLTELKLNEEKANQYEKERFERDSIQIQQLKAAQINELSLRIASAAAIQFEYSELLSQASKLLSYSKKHDQRFFLWKIFYETEEISKAKMKLQNATSQERKASNLLSELKAELVKATDDFDKQLFACRPKKYTPSFAEFEEIEKLEGRKIELLDKKRQKSATRKEGSNESQN